MPGRRAAVSGRRAARTSGLRIPTSLPSRAMNERRQAELDGGRSELSAAGGGTTSGRRPMTALAERLGFPPDAKLLIVNCDDLGSSHAANLGVYEALREGVATSATLMVPCPWARDAAARYRGEDVGVHLTLNAEYDLYRWGPITHAPSLLDGDGGSPRTPAHARPHPAPAEAR